jgi:hypothetical protein
MDALLPLAVHPMLEAESLELVRGDLASPEALDEEIKGINFPLVRPRIGFNRRLTGKFLSLGDVQMARFRLSAQASTHRPLLKKEATPAFRGNGLQLSGQRVGTVPRYDSRSFSVVSICTTRESWMMI